MEDLALSSVSSPFNLFPVHSRHIVPNLQVYRRMRSFISLVLAALCNHVVANELSGPFSSFRTDQFLADLRPQGAAELVVNFAQSEFGLLPRQLQCQNPGYGM